MRISTVASGVCGLLLLLTFVRPAAANEVTHRVRSYWPGGTFEIDLYGEDSPRHVANYLHYIDDGTYDYTYVHRSHFYTSTKFLQAGQHYFTTPFSPSNMTEYWLPTPYPEIKNEFDASNGLANTPGTIAAARRTGLDTAQAGFFINVTDNSGVFNAQNPYTVFGSVSSGFDVLSSLVDFPTAEQYFSNADPGAATAPVVNLGTSEEPFVAPPPFQKWVRVPLVTGDFNLDGVVDSADEAVWQAGQGDFDTGNLTADANGDWKVDEEDLAILQQHMGEGLLNDLPGDFNRNGVVNHADYLWWRTQFGSTTTLDADGNGDGSVNLSDYVVWRNNLGATLPGTASVAGVNIPEPSTWLLAAAATGLFWAARKKSGPRMSRTHAELA